MNPAFLPPARAEALFVSTVSAQSRLTLRQADDAIATAMRLHGGVRGCAADAAADYGDHPETAMHRMRWALSMVDQLYGSRRRPNRRPCVPLRLCLRKY